MTYDKQRVIDIALAEVGYLEKASNAQLDSKTANAGRANYTKYARDLDNPIYFNGKKNGYAWCAVFVCWCFVQAYGREAARKMLCHPRVDNCAAGCESARRYYMAKGRFFKTPQTGDQIFFVGSSGGSSHTGMVYKVDSDKVYTVEGNTSGASGVVANGGGVCRKSYDLNYYRIMGYGRPDFGTEVVAETPKEESKAPAENTQEAVSGETTANETWEVSFSMRTLRNGDKGIQVKILQYALDLHGYDPGSADGIFGSKTEKAVEKFQAAKGLTVDGVAGKNTWNKLLR